MTRTHARINILCIMWYFGPQNHSKNKIPSVILFLNYDDDQFKHHVFDVLFEYIWIYSGHTLWQRIGRIQLWLLCIWKYQKLISISHVVVPAHGSKSGIHKSWLTYQLLYICYISSETHTLPSTRIFVSSFCIFSSQAQECLNYSSLTALTTQLTRWRLARDYQCYSRLHPP